MRLHQEGWRLVPGQGRWVPADRCRVVTALYERTVTPRSLGVHMSTASLPILGSIGITDQNSLLRRYVKYWLLYQIVPVPVLLLGWYALRIGGAAHQWFWPLVLSVHCLLSL